jgi:hypothetical protein
MSGIRLYQKTEIKDDTVNMTTFLFSVFQCLVCHTYSVRRLEARYLESDHTI